MGVDEGNLLVIGVERYILHLCCCCSSSSRHHEFSPARQRNDEPAACRVPVGGKR